jgi:hypothetical protein
MSRQIAATEVGNLGSSTNPPGTPGSQEKGRLARVHVVSFLVRRLVHHDEEHGIVLGDIGKSAKTVSLLLSTFQNAFDRSGFSIPDETALRIMEAEKFDASDFRVATFLESYVLNETSLAKEASSLSVRLRAVFERLGSGVKDYRTNDMLDGLSSNEKNLALEIQKISRSARFLLTSEGSSRETEIRLTKGKQVEDNNRSKKLEATGKITAMPNRKQFVLDSREQGKLTVMLGGDEDQTLLGLCFAANLQVGVKLSLMESKSTKRSAQSKRYHLEQLSFVDSTDAARLEEFRLSLASFNSFLKGDLSLKISPPAPKQKASGKNKIFGSGIRLTP